MDNSWQFFSSKNAWNSTLWRCKKYQISYFEQTFGRTYYIKFHLLMKQGFISNWKVLYLFTLLLKRAKIIHQLVKFVLYYTTHIGVPICGSTKTLIMIILVFFFLQSSFHWIELITRNYVNKNIKNALVIIFAKNWKRL